MNKQQDPDIVFALDIGTRSVIGIIGKTEKDRFRVLGIEKQEHSRRSMMDGQIEDIDQVAQVVKAVVSRLEDKLQITLNRVCVAAAGRALKSQRASFALEFPEPRRITDEIIGQLETGAVSEAEAALQEDTENGGRFYMVGYSASQYLLDDYPMSSLKGHSGRKAQVDVVATFLPCAVVESLYAVVERVGLEVASLTLEPIASLNAAIPSDIRMLNLVLVDIGAGTSDIAVCRNGSVVGYTMVTVAGDEVTELIMKNLLVDFRTGERLKAELAGDGQLQYVDILGVQQEIPAQELREMVHPTQELLAREITEKILEFNTTAPSAVFLAGGGSKLCGLCQCVAQSLGMDAARVAIAGNHFEKSAFSEDYDIKDPEYATPLGIGISAALGMIHDSYIVTLNEKPAKLFRSGTLALRDILLMNGYHYGDMIGRTGANLSISLDGERLFFRGGAATSAEVEINGNEATLYDVVHAGDSIRFTPARSGQDAARTAAEVLGEDYSGTIIVNGRPAALDYSFRSGDVVVTDGIAKKHKKPEKPVETVKLVEPVMLIEQVKPVELAQPEEPVKPEEPVSPEQPEQMSLLGKALTIKLNGAPLALPAKGIGEQTYLMELLKYSGIDFDNLDKPVEIRVNGEPGRFSQELREMDEVIISCGT
ncbi:MAG: cell division protein FtsA [Clostridia bacterium]|nr:cell division protein FtsA [Clostridia bacterium]